jgi:quinol monooxygenase YgiN
MPTSFLNRIERDSMIHFIATIELNPSRSDDFLAEFRRLVPPIRAEDGCIEYGPTVDAPTDIPAQAPARPDVVTEIEKWDGVEHLKRHLDAPHMREYRERVKGLVAG